MKFAFRFPPSLPQAMASLAIFVILLVSLASIDERVHDKCAELLSSGQNVASLASRASELVDTVAVAVRYQSIENAPMVLFATVGGVLFLFMVRT
jgi:hypothetical protein